MIKHVLFLLAQARLLVGMRARRRTDDAAVAAGRALTHVSTRLLLYPHRRERIDVPGPVDVDGMRIDVIDDLVEYTGLAQDQVVSLVQRHPESFRTEWYSVPSAVRGEEWFYLASRTYLFANAVHDAESVANALSGFLPDKSDILDFGGGTGNLALALGTRGHHVDYLERSALQKDFVRFRVEKHRLADRVRVLDQWTSLAPGGYDLVCAFDVLEHIESLAETLPDVLRAIRPAGMLAESSPFVRSASNPMHHETEPEFLHLMKTNGFSPAHEDESFRLWRAQAGAGAGAEAGRA